MKKAKVDASSDSTARKMRPALSPEARENQLISLAVDLVEQRLRNGTASSQETTHFLKLGSSKEKLEKEKLRLETELVKAKTESIQAQQHGDEMYAEALNAFRQYSGQGDSDD